MECKTQTVEWFFQSFIDILGSFSSDKANVLYKTRAWMHNEKFYFQLASYFNDFLA